MELKNLFKSCKKPPVKSHGCGGAFYFLGFIGALIYYWSMSPTFLDGVIGFFKALLWPAFLIYQLFVFLGAG
ncbi:MAG: hypothetical protein JXC85_01625 [Candidatus Aenigmarchaeota archaeon]|nr:hypothetical protein [Candidatus Aenigmarchaeota archaeon]